MDVLAEIAERHKRLGIRPPFRTGRGLPVDVRATFSVDGAQVIDTVSFGDQEAVLQAQASDQRNLEIRKKLDRIEDALGESGYREFSGRLFTHGRKTRANIISAINTSDSLITAGQSELVPVILDVLDEDRFEFAAVPNDEEVSLSHQRQAALWYGEDLEAIDAQLAECRARHKVKNRDYFSNIILLKVESLSAQLDKIVLASDFFASWLRSWLDSTSQGHDFATLDEQLSLIDDQVARILVLNHWLKGLSPAERRSLDVSEVFELIEHQRLAVSEIDPDVKQQMIEVVSDKFLPGDDNDFEIHFLNNPNNKVQLFTCGEEILAFFGEEVVSEDLDLAYLDWFNLAKTSVRGVSAQSCMKAGVGSLIRLGKNLVCVAKPHVASFKALIEDLGFVGAGLTDEENYKHRYINCRHLSVENPELYKLKQLTETESATLAHKCLVLEPGSHQVAFETAQEDLDLEVVVLELSGCGDQDDIPEEALSSILPDRRSVITRVFQKGKKFALLYEPSLISTEVEAVLESAQQRFYDTRGY